MLCQLIIWCLTNIVCQTSLALNFFLVFVVTDYGIAVLEEVIEGEMTLLSKEAGKVTEAAKGTLLPPLSSILSRLR